MVVQKECLVVSKTICHFYFHFVSFAFYILKKPTFQTSVYDYAKVLSEAAYN
jgi:hypothetical protein